MPGSNNRPAADRSDTGAKLSLIEVKKVSKKIGSVTAVADVAFEIQANRICGLVGSDGAGKTTLLRMIATMVPPTSGHILVDGLDVVSQRSRVKKVCGYMPQRFGLYQDLTVVENLDFFMDIYSITGSERTRRREYYLGFSNLLPFLDRKAGDLSGGMKQKLGLACVLVHQPKVLILDEPTNGVDPVSRREFWDILAEMKRNGMTILVSTAYLDEGEKCDQLMLMHNGYLLEFARPEDIQADFTDLEEAMIHRIQTADQALAEDQFGF
ncbi:MAG: ABC transporter ATP-binding protein [Deltaproteobacteria bacterium]|jgi:ABC-2 type transport system ATP-binding protein|nr:ABC transporter ATP-binding protein [Deltaproteobacteria bacterium]MBW2486942.1 ABC transporter ATP-binding protein [Deltaproteobacteria bacterium]MBW2515830.1 ABC transporter ATP-binding protein [Deltaproteobacteria bacterium]